MKGKYCISISPKAKKELNSKRFINDREKILKEILQLKNSSYIYNNRKKIKKLKGYDCKYEIKFHTSAGSTRCFFEINKKDHEILVIEIVLKENARYKNI